MAKTMGRSDAPTAVFIETNLGTRLAVPASPDITAKDFKREVERMHLSCFPELGNIKVNAVMVKHKLHCYHLPGSLPLKYAFLGSNVTWFLQTLVSRVDSLNHKDTNVHNLSSAAKFISDSVEMGGGVMQSSREERKKCKRKKVNNVQRFQNLKASALKTFAVSCCLRKRKGKNLRRKQKIGDPREKPGTNLVTEVMCEAASVSGIIKKYFSDYDEVASSPEYFPTTVRHRRKKQQFDKMSSVSGHVVSRDAWPEKPGSQHKKTGVGKRLLLASDSLGLTPSNRRSILSLCRRNGGDSLLHKFTDTVRNPVFDITDEGD